MISGKKLISLVIILIISFLINIKSESSNDLFKTWYESHGGIINGIEITHFDHMGRGFVTNRDIHSDEYILRIPSHLVFSISNLKKKKDDIYIQISKSFSSDEAVMVWLLLERQKDEESFYKPYIEILPNYLPSLIFFSDLELMELQNNDLMKEALEMQREYSESFENFKDIASSFWPYTLLDISLDDYKWATAIVSSRGLRFRGEVYLSPMADIFNYASHTVKREANSGEFFLKHHILSENGTITIFADRDVIKGEQLFEDYGDNNDDLYLKYHGFVADNNPFTCFKLDAVKYINKLSSQMPIIKRDLFKAFEFKQFPSKCVDSSGKLDVGLEVMSIILAFDEFEAKNCLSVIQTNTKAWNKIFSECGIQNVIVGLVNIRKGDNLPTERSSLLYRTISIVQDLITHSIKENGFTTSLEEDSSLLSDVQVNLNNCNSCPENKEFQHKLLAIQYRIKKKELVNKLCALYNKKDCLVISKQQLVAPNLSLNKSLETKIEEFNIWFDSHNPKSSIVAKVIPQFRIGTIAKTDIFIDDNYLSVPVNIILESEVGYQNAGISYLLQSLHKKFNVRDDFHELLLFLIYEMFIVGEMSIYWPYLNLLPQLHELDIPIIWTESEIHERLQPSQAKEEALLYRNRVQKKFEMIKNIQLISDFFSNNFLTYNIYLWATVILDSRSIWWNGKRHLVPMLDFINCREDPLDPAKVHSTKLDPTSFFAITNAGGTFLKDEQLFENYGQPNHIYFMYHGFSLVNNSHDCVHYIFKLTTEEFNEVSKSELGTKILNRLGLSPRNLALDQCIMYPVPQMIWLFLSLKMNNYEELQEKKLLGGPTKDAIIELINIIDQQLPSYKHYSNSHIASASFIQSEYVTYLKTKDKLITESKTSSLDNSNEEL